MSALLAAALAAPAGIAYGTVALAVALESVGVPLPGEAVLVSAALLAVSGSSLSLPGLVLCAAAGAVAGDSVGYALGRRCGPRLLGRLGRWFPRHLSDDHLAYAADVMARRGVLAVTAGRFVALLRVLAGPLAGALHMPYRRFLAANALGAVLWSATVVGVVGAAGTAAQGWLSGSSWVALVVGAVLVVAFLAWGDRALQRRVSSFADRRRQRDTRPAPSPG